MTLTRKEFLSTVVTAVAGAAGAAWLAGCGSSGDDDDGGGGDCLANGTSASISDNHRHVLVVSKAEVMTATAHTYDITGQADHGHMVTISASAFAMLAANQSVMTVSTTGANHTHNITVSCL
jgi:hypothetical protein